MYTPNPMTDIRLPTAGAGRIALSEQRGPSVLDRYGTQWVMVTTILFSQGIESVLSRAVGGGLQSKLTLVFIALSFLCVVLPALILRTRSFLYTLWVSLPFTLYGVVAVLSYFWSIAPGETMKWGTGVLGLNLAGVALASMFSWRTIFKGVAWGILFLAVLSVLNIARDGLETDIHIGALRGLWNEKNASSEAFAVGAVVCAVVALADRKPAYLLGMVFLLGCLYKAGSAGAMAACALSLSGLFFIETIRRGPIRFFLGIFTALVFVGLIVLVIASLGLEAASILGRDTNLTGRTEIWPTVLSFIHGRPWLGYGFGAFWVENSEPFKTVANNADFLVFNAHNSFFEQMLNFGYVGSFFIWFGVARAMFQASTALFGVSHARRLALPLFLLMLFISLSESALGGPAGVGLLIVSVLVPKVALGTAMARNRFNP